MAQNNAAKTGIDFQTNSHASDIEAWIDDGEHAVVWTLKRVEDDDGEETDLIEVRKFYFEAGFRDEIGGADVFEEERTVSEHAREEILPNAEDKLEKASEYWS